MSQTGCPRRAICRRHDRISSKSWATVLPKSTFEKQPFHFFGASHNTNRASHEHSLATSKAKRIKECQKNQFVKPKNSGIACQTRKDYHEQFQFFEPKRVCLLFEVKEPTGVRSLIIMNDRQNYVFFDAKSTKPVFVLPVTLARKTRRNARPFLLRH
ncbi:hypothetical protein CDAR_535251 [Caerostris darwini]|uniref:Uncharacterized protein n=1 Tax=Caerostris darwini TaxID=1538125 RepID=A0AAV4QGI4_9ARAC|nr:hypothetical protein CDAR_535251 [Caerostris darwini]